VDLVRWLPIQSSVHLLLQCNNCMPSDQCYCCFNHGQYRQLHNLRSKQNNCALHLYVISWMWYYRNLNNYFQQHISRNLYICKHFRLVDSWFHFTNIIFEWFVACRFNRLLKADNNLGRNLFKNFNNCG
jgi:hypothetical protein